MTLSLLAAITLLAASQEDEWVPPDEVNSQSLMNLLQSIKQDRLAGDHKTALAKHVWYHRASRTVPAQAGVRMSFAMGDWVELAKAYPKAFDAMRELRDEAGEIIKSDVPDNEVFAAFRDLIVFNQKLNEVDESIKLFAWAHKEKPRLAKRMFRTIRSDLVKAGRFELCAAYIDTKVDSLIRFHKILRNQAPGSAMRLLAPQASEIAVILANTNRVDDAKAFKKNLLAELEEDERKLLAYDLDRAITGTMPTAFVCLTEAEQKTYAKLIEGELNQLAKSTDLKPELRTQLNDALKPTVIRAALAHAEANINIRLLGVAPDAYYSGIATEVQKACGDAKGCNTYLSDLDARRTFSKQFIADNFLVLLDRELWLTAQQYSMCEKLVDQLATKSQLPIPYLAARDLRELIRPFSKVLTKDQLELWEHYIQRHRTFGPKSRDARRNEVRGDLKLIAARRIAWMTDELSLSPKVVRRLQLVAKSTLGNTSDNRADAKFRLDSIVQGRPVDDDGPVGHGAQGLSDYFTTSRWGKLVRKQLTDDQTKAFTEKLLVRSTRARRRIAAQHIVVGEAYSMLSGENLIKLRNMIMGDDSVKPDPLAASPFAGIYRPLPESTFIEEIGEEAWRKLPADFRNSVSN